MKRTLSALVLLTFAVPALAASFPDTAGSEFDNEIGLLKLTGVISGYSDGTFHPDQPINRAEFVKILLAHKKETTGVGTASCFTDFKAGQTEWYYGYACRAKELGYIQGYPDGSFGGTNNINLAEALKITLEAYDIELPKFAKAPDHWYDYYIIAARDNGLIAKIGDNPAHLVTRGEMAYLVVRTGQRAAISSSSSTSTSSRSSSSSSRSSATSSSSSSSKQSSVMSSASSSVATTAYNSTSFSIRYPSTWNPNEEASVETPYYETSGTSFSYAEDVGSATIMIEIKSLCPSIPSDARVGDVTYNGRTYAMYEWKRASGQLILDGRSYIHSIDSQRCFIGTTFMYYLEKNADSQSLGVLRQNFYESVDAILMTFQPK